MSRGFLLSFIALSAVLGVLFAAFPLWDLEVARLFFDSERAKFPLSINYEWNLVRQAANWVPFLLLAPALFALLRKLVFPEQKMLIAPSVVIYLLGSFLLGPGVTSNLLLKENWGRPRPIGVQQFAGTADFQPWWRRLAAPSCSARRSAPCASCSGGISSAISCSPGSSPSPSFLRSIGCCSIP